MARAARVGLFMIPAMVCLAAPASAQPSGTITLHNQINFRGLALTVDRAQENLRVPWQVRSVSIGRGGPWELCLRPRFQNCRRFDQSGSNIRMTVLSARPVLRPIPPPTGSGSLRGMASEYFPQPSDGRGRVISCPSGAAACAAESADRFCRSRGWTRAAFQLQETVNRQNFLADVLCSRS